MFFFRDKSLNVYQIKVCGALGLFVFMIFNFSMILFCFFGNWFCEEKFVPFLSVFGEEKLVSFLVLVSLIFDIGIMSISFSFGLLSAH